ncbi:MAG: WYL domain-containing protein, partial [Candidatus Marsarchaeota archaeon]|nr:WYL domain-containing protein [Candidatus Marsarchaeota archaeon]
CHEHEKVIQMKLLRFQEAKGTGVKFRVPDGFSVEDYFSLSWEAWAGGEPERVRVRFSPEMAQMVSEVKRHHTQEIYPQPDGGIVFEATVAGIEEIAIWIMGFGKDAEVLAPESLRLHVIDHISGMAANYLLIEEATEESIIELA